MSEKRSSNKDALESSNKRQKTECEEIDIGNAVKKYVSKKMLDYKDFTLHKTPVNFKCFKKKFSKYVESVEGKYPTDDYELMLAFFVLETNENHYGSYELQLLLQYLYLEGHENIKLTSDNVKKYLYHPNIRKLFDKPLSQTILKTIAVHTNARIPWVHKLKGGKMELAYHSLEKCDAFGYLDLSENSLPFKFELHKTCSLNLLKQE